jgi:hypothetical protein
MKKLLTALLTLALPVIFIFGAAASTVADINVIYVDFYVYYDGELHTGDDNRVLSEIREALPAARRIVKNPAEFHLSADDVVPYTFRTTYQGQQIIFNIDGVVAGSSSNTGSGISSISYDNLMTAINRVNQPVDISEKLCEELETILAAANDDDLIYVWLFTENGFNSIEIDAATFEILENMDIEKAFREGIVTNPELDPIIPFHIYDLQGIVRNSVVRELAESFNDNFIANHVNPQREILLASTYTSTIVLAATPAEIRYFATLDTVGSISWYDDGIVLDNLGSSEDEGGGELAGISGNLSAGAADEVSDESKNESDTKSVNAADSESDSNPATGIILGITIPTVVAAAALIISKKRKN